VRQEIGNSWRSGLVSNYGAHDTRTEGNRSRSQLLRTRVRWIGSGGSMKLNFRKAGKSSLNPFAAIDAGRAPGGSHETDGRRQFSFETAGCPTLRRRAAAELDPPPCRLRPRKPTSRPFRSIGLPLAELFLRGINLIRVRRLLSLRRLCHLRQCEAHDTLGGGQRQDLS
jgi:hypothetical protein